MFHTVFYIPLYNALIFLTSHLWGNIGLAVIALTLIVKLILSPLSYSSIKSQIEQKKLQPLIDEIKKKYPDSKEQSAKTMELYKEHKTNPLAGCLLLLLQLPVIIALYRVFSATASITGTELYSFVHLPAMLHVNFLWINMTAKNIILAIIAGVTQFLQMHWSPAMQAGPKNATGNTQADMATSMTKSMKYTMPIMIVVFGYLVPAAVTLYWIISNIFMIVQERFIVVRMRTKPGAVTVIKAK